MRDLTPREREVIKTLAGGLSRKHAAHVLGISEQTLRNHCNNAYRKLGVTDLVGAMHAMGYVKL